MKLQVVIHPAEEGGFWAEIPAFGLCFRRRYIRRNTVKY